MELHPPGRLTGAAASAADPAQASLAARLKQVCGDAAAAATSADGLCLRTMPPIRRTPMAPRRWPPRLHFWRRGSARRGAAAEPDLPHAHHHAARWRRALLFLLAFAQTIVATGSMNAVLPYHGQQPIEIAILVLFAILFFWVSVGFWTAVMGFVLLISGPGRDRHAISASAPPDASIDAAVRTAIVMPICNEDVARVFAGLSATFESLSRCGQIARFDFFVLSDSNRADLRVAEIDAWLSLCRAKQAFGKIFYRWRRTRIKRKSGNIADFCRRWGANYRYMVILDADSVMSGDCLTRLVQLMEANPGAGIIQTAPIASGKVTLHARIQQFAGRLYGPLFTAGLHFWQLGEAHYWGHNAIIRVAPFIAHCAIGRLPGGADGEVEILSHDFVEAALMRRAGWAVWIAYDLPGSFEEMPPNLLDELARDRRWCQGNLINARLLLAEGLHPAHRAVFVTGVMAYLSALLWFLFLLLSTALLAVHTLDVPEYFSRPYQLFPDWPQWHHDWAIWLFGATSALLFTPKLLAVILQARRGARAFGGLPRMSASMLAELVYSMLLAPIRMLFHSQFVAAALAGSHGGWTSPPRDNVETRWRDALAQHGTHTLIGCAWAAFVYWLNPAYLAWLLPVVGALALSIPLSVWSSRTAVGKRLRARRFFLIPEESAPPRELVDLHGEALAADERARPTFLAAVVDPLINAMVCAAGGRAAVKRLQGASSKQNGLVERALNAGPRSLSERQKLELIDDAAALTRLHLLVASSPAAHADWVRLRAGAATARQPA